MGGSKKLRAKASKAAAATAGSGAGNLTRPPDSSSDVARWGTVDMRDAEDKCRRPRAGWVRHCGGSATCRLVPRQSTRATPRTAARFATMRQPTHSLFRSHAELLVPPSRSPALPAAAAGASRCCRRCYCGRQCCCCCRCCLPGAQQTGDHIKETVMGGQHSTESAVSFCREGSGYCELRLVGATSGIFIINE